MSEDDRLRDILTEKQYSAYEVLVWVTIALFSSLLILTCFNIYKGLIAQGRWRTSTMLVFFYVYFVLSITFRLVVQIYSFQTLTPAIQMVAVLAPYFKISLGFVHVHMLFELQFTMQILGSVSSAAKIGRMTKLIKWSKALVICLTILGLILVISFGASSLSQ